MVLGLHSHGQVHGMSQAWTTTGSAKFFPFVLKDFSLWGVVFFVLACCPLPPLESFFYYPLFEPFDRGSTPRESAGGYFFFVYPLELLPSGS